MCSWNWEKIKIVDKGFIKETGFFNIYIKEKCKCFFFIFISVILWLAFFGVCIFIHYFFAVVRTGVNQKKIKSSKKICLVNVLSILTNEKHFPKTIGQWEFGCGLFTNLPRIVVACDFSPSSFSEFILPLDKISILTWKLLVTWS